MKIGEFWTTRIEQLQKISEILKIQFQDELSLCEFHATRRIRFDVSDLFQNRPYWKGAASRGRSVCKKKREKMFDEILLNFRIRSGAKVCISVNIVDLAKSFQKRS